MSAQILTRVISFGWARIRLRQSTLLGDAISSCPREGHVAEQAALNLTAAWRPSDMRMSKIARGAISP